MGIFQGLRNVYNFIRYSDGSVFYRENKTSPLFFGSQDYLKIALNHPVVSACIDIRAEFLSKVRFYKENSDGTQDFDDPVVKFLDNPNPLQTKEEFLKQFEWFRVPYGWVYQRPVQGIMDELPFALYNLNPSQITFPETLRSSILTDASEVQAFFDQTFTYKDQDVTKTYAFKDIIPFFDLGSDLLNDYSVSSITSPSKLKSIIKQISNISIAGDAENVILQTNGREMIFADAEGSRSGVKLPTTPDDKDEINRVLNNKYNLSQGRNRTLTPNKKMGWIPMNIKLTDLGYKESLETNGNIIAQRLGVPNEIYKAFTTGDTFENQAEATVNFIQNTIQPIADNLASSFTERFGNEEEPIKATFEHLPSMQRVQQRKAEAALRTSQTLFNLSRSGFAMEQAIEFLMSQGIEIDESVIEQARQMNNNQNNNNGNV